MKHAQTKAQCPAGHSLEVYSEGGLLFGDCKVCDDTWRLMGDGTPIPHGHPLG